MARGLTSGTVGVAFKDVNKMFAATKHFPEIVGAAMLVGAQKYIVPPIKAAAPVGKPKPGGHRPGRLRSGINAYSMTAFAQKAAQQGRAIAPIYVGPRHSDFWYAKWVVRGTHRHVIAPRKGKAVVYEDIVRRRFQHRGAKPNPFLHAADRNEAKFIDYVSEQFMDTLKK